MKKTKTKKGESQGAALLSAVERIVDPPESIETRVKEADRKARGSLPRDASDEQILRLVERRLISHYSTRTALAGGASAMPALIPGLGSLAAVLGGGLIDMTLCLKFEVEMVLALASARGHKIKDPRERQLAYLLAAIHTYEAGGGTLPIEDLVKAELDAVWNYTPRQLAKLVGALFVRLALLYSGTGIAKAIPFVGMVVSAAANKTLTRRVGAGVVKALDERALRRTSGQKAPPRKKKAS